jgi:hypothetical protein
MFAEPAMPALSVFTIKSRRSVRYAMPIDELVNQRVLQPPTMLPWGDDGPRERLTPDYKSRAVQGYADDSEPIGQLGEQTSYYHPYAARHDGLSRRQSIHDCPTGTPAAFMMGTATTQSARTS